MKDRYMTILGGYTLDRERNCEPVRRTVDLNKSGDYGADPLGMANSKWFHPATW